MKRFIKYGLWTAGTAAIIAGSAVAYIAATFDPNDYKAQIVQLVKDKNQRTLKLEGDIKLALFPKIGVNIGKLSLSEFQSDKEFLAVDSARISLALIPLLSKQLVVDEVVINGLKAELINFKGGKSNIDDLLVKDESKSEGQPLKFDIASVRLEMAQLSYRDQASSAHYKIKNLSLQTGRITAGVPSKVNFSAEVQANQPKLDMAIKMRTVFTFDLEKQAYHVEGLDLGIKGNALDISNLALQASGDASANLATQEFTARKLALFATGSRAQDNFEVKLDAPALNLTKDKFSGERLIMNGKLNGALGNIVASLTLHDLGGGSQLFSSSGLTLELDMKQVDQAFKVKLNSPVTGNFEKQQFNLSSLTVAVNATGDKLPNKSVNSEMKGSVQIDGGRQSLQANLAGGLLQSQIKARVALNNFTAPAIRFDADIDQFDADLYLPKQTAAETKKPAAAEQPLDITALRDLNVEGGLRVGALKISNIKLTQLRLDMKAHNGQLNINPLSAGLYQGNMSGSLSVNAQAIPSIVISQNLTGVNIAALLKDAADFDMLEGKGRLMMNLSTQGNTVSAMKKGLTGNAALNLADGAIRGIDLGKRIRAAQALGKGGAAEQTQNANKEEKTEFSEFKASFKVSNGVAHNEDLSVKSPQLRLAGSGDIDIGNDSINYVARTTLLKSADGQGGSITVPVHLSGAFTDLKYRLDFAAVVADVARQKIETKKDQLKTQVQEQLKSKLKGLFK